MKRSIFCAVIFVVMMGFVNRTHEDKMGSFKWLVGTWVMNGPQGRIMETWLPMSDSILSGQSTLYKKTSETVPLEQVKLVCRGKDFFYIPVAQGQNNNKPVEFKITSYSKNKFTAENPDHDFPKRITYILFKKDSLHAYIDGGAKLPGKRSDYYYARYKKPTEKKPSGKN